MIATAQIERILDRYSEIEARMASDPGASFAKLAKEYSDLGPIVTKAREVQKMRAEITHLGQLANDPDADVRAMANEELVDLKRRLPEAERELSILMLPKDSADMGSAFLEIRAGTGGDEAALFAGDLLDMYRRYAQLQGWRFEIMSESPSDLGGYKEVICSVGGNGVFAKLKYESGVHRVQRVPATEAQGRIHTSAATVAVMPEAEDVDIEINESDLRIDVYRASGAGGQHVNKTESAVRITHIPTGVVVAMQEEKSQHKNKAKAMKILKARIYDAERERQDKERAADRKEQVGSGDRSERIRTYNFPQGRCTDHRINLTLYELDQVMQGIALNKIIDALVNDDQAKRLAQLGETAS
ncbi:MAG: peptide chain release factor 1 [Alphaproteobacteria bacterium]|nr:peptide chain release factor 1 [Alphaproteobacteria bacterium]